MDGGKKASIEALDVSKVKVIEDMIIKPNHVLIEVINMSKSGLLLPSNIRSNILDKFEVIKVGESVNMVKVGDIIVDLMLGNAEYLYTDKEHGDRKFILVDVYNVLIAVNPGNYDSGI
jgi:hypothetical protein